MAAVGLAWDVQAVPERIYEEARARKARLARPSLTAADPDALRGPVGLDLADEAEPV